MRSSWKLKTIDLPFFRRATLERVQKLDAMKIWNKGTYLFSDFLEKNINVYNGVKFIEIPVKKEMLGTFVGNYVLTKRITADIHSKTKKIEKVVGKKNKFCVWGI